MAHVHEPETGFVYLEDTHEWLSDESTSSVVRTSDRSSKKRDLRVDNEVSFLLLFV